MGIPMPSTPQLSRMSMMADMWDGGVRQAMYFELRIKRRPRSALASNIDWAGRNPGGD